MEQGSAKESKTNPFDFETPVKQPKKSEALPYDDVPFSRRQVEPAGREQIGEWKTQKELIAKVKAYAMDNFANKTIKNDNDGRSILIPRSGIKHTTSRIGSEAEALATLQIPSLLKKADYEKFEADYKERVNVKGMHTYTTSANIDGNSVAIRLFVRETQEGSRFYDHYEIKEDAGGQYGDRDKPFSSTLLPAPSNTPSIDQPTTKKQADSVDALTDKKLGAVSDEAIRAIIERVGERHRTVAVESFNDLAPLVPDVKKQADKEGHDGSDVDGFIHKGTVYLVKENIARHKDPEAAAETVLLHEYTHGDIRNLFGDNIAKELNGLFKVIGGYKGMKAIADKHNIDLSAYVKAGQVAGRLPEARLSMLMDELLAFIGQEKPSLKGKVKEIVGMIRQWLRDKGLLKLAKTRGLHTKRQASKPQAGQGVFCV